MPGLLDARRVAALLGSIVVAICSGTTYIYSAYAPQLGTRLNISHTQLNIVGLAGNVGLYGSGPLWGRILDARGPKIPLIGASTFCLVGYTGIKYIYEDDIASSTAISPVYFVMLVMCGLLVGTGGSAGGGSGINVTAKSFPDFARATATSMVVSGIGLSAFFYSSIAQTFFPGDTSALLLLLSLGTSMPILVAMLVMRPVPFPSIYLNQTTNECEDYEPTGSRVDVNLTAQAAVSFIDTSETNSHTPLLGNQPAIGAEILPDVHGIQLFKCLDFHFVISIVSLLCGTGLMYINNVGSISMALYASSNAVYDQIEASKWQAAQVSMLSIGSFAGRILIGPISDYAHFHHHLPRTYCLILISSIFIISQAIVIDVSRIEALWIASAVLGLAYGSVWGALPTIMIEWFGLAHISENYGYVTMAPLVGGNLFSIMFGQNLDAHTPRHGSERQCLLGRECYVWSLRVTLAACIVALALSTWAGIRDRRRNIVKRGLV